MKNNILFTPLLILLVIFGYAFTIASENTDKAYEAAEATEWKIDRAHSNISFEVTHFFTPVSGQFKEFSSEIFFNPQDLKNSRVDVQIAVKSIDTDNQKRDNHLRSPDFFNAEKFPYITFKSDEIVSVGDNKYVAKGRITMKDITKQIELPFTLLGIKDHPQRQGTQIAGIKIDHTLDRTDFNVGVGDFATDTIVGDDVEISIALELNSGKS